MVRTSKITMISIPATFLILTLAIYISSITIMHPSIWVKGIEICKLTRTQVLDMLENKIETSQVGSSISLNYEDKQWNLKFSDVDYSYNYYEAVNMAYMAKEKAGFIDKMRNFFNIGNSGLNIDITHSYNKAYIDNLIEKIAKEIDRESVVATITLKSGNFIIMDDIPGRSLDKKKTYELIIDQLDKAVADSIQLPVVITEPTVKKSDLLNIKDKLGEFSTEFNTSDSDRASNLSLATRNTSNVLLLPDDVFSFNKIVGPRLEKYGFKMAKIIVNNQYTSGIGGGICQVSSTLYNAVLYSNLEVVERKNHSLPSTYVDMGRDATISGDYIDLKFKNNTGYPIYIYGEMKGNKVKFTIYGKDDFPERSIELKTKIVSKTEPTTEIIEDPTLPVGTVIEERKPSPSYTVKSYKIIKEKGKDDIIEPLYTDVYPLVNGIKRVGTKK